MGLEGGPGVFGDRFTGAPDVGLGLSDRARDCRIGWRPASAVGGDPGFDLDATRRESANDNGAFAGAGSETGHGPTLRGALRW